jgi:leader peptidase (prepilin peptidase)/N-methyltransferase
MLSAAGIALLLNIIGALLLFRIYPRYKAAGLEAIAAKEARLETSSVKAPIEEEAEDNEAVKPRQVMTVLDDADAPIESEEIDLKANSQEQKSTKIAHKLWPLWTKPSKRLIIYTVTMIVVNTSTAAIIPCFYGSDSLIQIVPTLCAMSLLWPVALVDYVVFRIPNHFIIVGLVFMALMVLINMIIGTPGLLLYLLMTLMMAVIIAGVLLLISLILKGMGFGDIKLLFVVSLLMGVEKIWGALLLSLIVAFFVAVFLLVLKKKQKQDLMPFAPFVMIGTYASIVLAGF